MSEAFSPLYFNKTLLHKSSERSSLFSGPGWNSSPLEAKNPGVFHGSSTTFQVVVVVVQLFSHVWFFAIPWTAAHQASLSFTISQSLLKFMSIESVMSSNQLILCRPLLLPPSVFPSIRVYSSESVLHIRWPKHWSSASASVLPMNIQDWFSLGWTGWISLQSKRLSRVFFNTTVQKHQFFRCSAFFIVQLSHPYITNGKNLESGKDWGWRSRQQRMKWLDNITDSMDMNLSKL